jgi:hypothetical protein
MHSLLITAYKNPDQLAKLIGMFPEEHFNVYVHIDKKSDIDVEELQKKTGNKPNIRIYKKYNVNWGSRNHLKAILWLSVKAIEDTRNHFFHLITGQDLPIRPVEDFINKLDCNKDYIQAIPYPVSYLPKGATDWFDYYNLYDWLDAKKHLKWIRLIRNLQIKLGWKRPFDKPFAEKYYGSTYWSLTRETLEYVVKYTKEKPAFFRRMRHTFCAEELYFTTVIMNSLHRRKVAQDNLRFIKWEAHGKTGSPKVLTASDREEMLNSGKWFARKFD